MSLNPPGPAPDGPKDPPAARPGATQSQLKPATQAKATRQTAGHGLKPKLIACSELGSARLNRWPAAAQAPGHGDGHRPADHGFVVCWQAFAVAQVSLTEGNAFRRFHSNGLAPSRSWTPGLPDGLGCLDRLGVDDRGGGLGIAARGDPATTMSWPSVSLFVVVTCRGGGKLSCWGYRRRVASLGLQAGGVGAVCSRAVSSRARSPARRCCWDWRLRYSPHCPGWPNVEGGADRSPMSTRAGETEGSGAPTAGRSSHTFTAPEGHSSASIAAPAA